MEHVGDELGGVELRRSTRRLQLCLMAMTLEGASLKLGAGNRNDWNSVAIYLPDPNQASRKMQKRE